MESLTQIYKKYRFVLLILLTGLVLLLLPDSGKKEKEIPAEEGEVFSLEETQRSMEEILGRIEGTGRLQLMLTLKSSSQLQLAEDQERSAGDSEMQLRQEHRVYRSSANGGGMTVQLFYEENDEQSGET